MAKFIQETRSKLTCTVDAVANIALGTDATLEEGDDVRRGRKVNGRQDIAADEIRTRYTREARQVGTRCRI